MQAVIRRKNHVAISTFHLIVAYMQCEAFFLCIFDVWLVVPVIVLGVVFPWFVLLLAIFVWHILLIFLLSTVVGLLLIVVGLLLTVIGLLLTVVDFLFTILLRIVGYRCTSYILLHIPIPVTITIPLVLRATVVPSSLALPRGLDGAFLGIVGSLLLKGASV